MNVYKLLDLLKEKMIVLEVQGDSLSYRGAKESVSSELLGMIRDQKKEIIEVLNREKSGSGITSAKRNGLLDSSFSQQRLWFLNELDPAAGSAYLIFDAVHLAGKLHVDILQAALDIILNRHDVLRAQFSCVDGKVMQESRENKPFDLSIKNLQDASEEDRHAAIVSAHHDEVTKGFDLSQGPLIRGQLLRFSEEDHVFLVTQHHIVSDGWSIGVLIQELTALYTAFYQGSPDPLPPLAIQYADYAAWQRNTLQGATLQRQVSFWHRHLAGAPALLELPTDRPRSAEQSYQGGRVQVTLPAALASGLRNLSRRHGVTLFMTLFGAWSVLLARLSGQNDIVVGTPVANRERAELNPLIGFFVNTLALRTQLGDDPSVGALLARIKATALEAYTHQDLPFEQVVEALNPVRSLSHSPLFQAIMVFNNLPRPDNLTLPGLTLTALKLPSQTTQFDLGLSLTDHGNIIDGHIEYASDLFDHATAQRYAGHFQTLLQSMASDDTQAISQLALLTAPER
ncbi:condensation domain-containing protein, partial [Janthinobacterium sp. GB4P2]|uniref:condensation domain-containing protein n=1 Tax=Janthinobacterium sp. GB4P2 TaxID=3424189 RepID=UPI003F22ABB8